MIFIIAENLLLCCWICSSWNHWYLGISVQVHVTRGLVPKLLLMEAKKHYIKSIPNCYNFQCTYLIFRFDIANSSNKI